MFCMIGLTALAFLKAWSKLCCVGVVPYVYAYFAYIGLHHMPAAPDD